MMLLELYAPMLLACLSVWALHLRRFDYQLNSIGTFRRVFNEPVRDADERCADCHERFDEGERRTWGREAVLFGMIVGRDQDGERYYCRRHADVDVQLALEDEPEPSRWTELRADVLAFIAIVVEAIDDSLAEVESDDPFSDVASGVQRTISASFCLLFVACLVIVASAATRSLQHSMPGSADTRTLELIEE
ncbi:hypothetical protein [Halomarina oriensis]|uniref:DUF8108 domain-containing protein n=1 Tax=Halomarina oriensis TaxID=671145 RepID=A0A6B0GPF8_9EURY|nr:hypothetical protein [Halomarina oriensis]MWG35881.1 hypothetical protein [Halomarina oriensis]